MKFRTLKQAVAEITTADPESRITLHLIKKMAHQNKIRALKTGSKLLIDVDSLLAYLKGEEYELPLKTITID